MIYRTLGELRAELMARLGMGAQGASGASQALMNSFLRNGQAQLYRAQDWVHLTDYKDVSLGVGQNLLDYPTGGTMNAAVGCVRNQRLLRVEVLHATEWRELRDGIKTEHWNNMDTRSYPARFQRLAQVLIYPRADQIYNVRFWFVRDLAPFTVDGDRASLDDEMVLLHAVATGKAHYRHPDSTIYQGQLRDLLSSLRAQSFGIGRDSVVKRDTGEIPEARPLVVGRDV